MYKLVIITAVLYFISQNGFTQNNSITTPTRQDSLKGSITPERAWWNLLYYDITIQPDIAQKTIQGKVVLRYKVLKPPNGTQMQIDLQQPLQIDSVFTGKVKLAFHQEGNAWFISTKGQKKNTTPTIEIYYSGKPKESIDPPWDGGFVWVKDSLGRPWVAVACQLVGASVWYPCKAHQSDEPDSGASISVIVPDTLIAIGNGQLKSKRKDSDTTIRYMWQVINPINNYGITFYIGKYVNVTETYPGEKGALAMDYWILDYNQPKVKSYLSGEVNKTVKIFEHWFGPYPFYADGFKMVEAPYVGMEHQSAIGYGNGFRWGRIKLQNLTPWDYKTDRLVVHETAHEWFGNNITTKDFTDRWVHEGFAGFAEELFIEAQYGKEAANEFFLARTGKRISNKEPLIRRYGIFEDAGSDMYLKGWTVIHMIRALIDDDNKFRWLLRGLTRNFYHQAVTSKQVENFIAKEVGKNLIPLFDQYLRRNTKPVLEYKRKGSVMEYRFSVCVEGFSMPIKTNLNNRWLIPTTQWQQINVAENKGLVIDTDFYIDVKEVLPAEQTANSH